MTRPDHEETIFTWGAPPLKFGAGAADEIGFDLAGFGIRRVLVVTDPRVNALGAPSRIADALRRYDVEARSNMMMAATFAGMGFGNAGVHIPHANGYPIAGMVRDYRPAGYPQDEPMVPHGQSVSLTAPETFRFTFDAAPQRHLRAAELLDPGADRVNDQREQLPSVLVALMRDIGIPNGIGGVGYTEADVPDLVPGTMKQQRLLATCAKTPTEDDIAAILARSVQNW